MDIHEIPLRSFHELLDNSVKSSELEASLRPLTNEDAMVGSLSYFPESVQLHKTYPDSIF